MGEPPRLLVSLSGPLLGPATVMGSHRGFTSWTACSSVPRCIVGVLWAAWLRAALRPAELSRLAASWLCFLLCFCVCCPLAGWVSTALHSPRRCSRRHCRCSAVRINRVGGQQPAGAAGTVQGHGRGQLGGVRDAFVSLPLLSATHVNSTCCCTKRRPPVLGPSQCATHAFSFRSLSCACWCGSRASRNTNWLSASVSYCSWYGIVCNGAGE
jgi:hypothetical protein